MDVCRDQFEVELQPDWVFELDSSHAGKFSRHLILRLPGIAFVNNWAVGHLVGQILAEPEVCLLLSCYMHYSAADAFALICQITFDAYVWLHCCTPVKVVWLMVILTAFVRLVK